MNVLNLPGVPFLEFYILAAGFCLLLLLAGRHLLGPLHPSATAAELDMLELAYLVGGHTRCVDTIMVGLFETGALNMDAPRTTVSTAGYAGNPQLRENFPGPLPARATRDGFLRRGAAKSRAIHARLANLGLIASAADRAYFTLCGGILLSMPLILGAAKIHVGLQRGRPVGDLCGLLFLTAALGAILLLKGPIRTPAGRQILTKIKTRYARAARAPLPEEMMLAFALTGASVLIGRSYQTFFATSSGGSSGCSGGGCSGGGCGGGCGGCGS